MKARGKSILVEVEIESARYNGTKYVSRVSADTKIPLCETHAETAGKVVEWIASNKNHKPLKEKLDAYQKRLQNASI